MTDGGAIANFHAANNSESFEFKQEITGKTANANGKKDVQIMVPLKDLKVVSTTFLIIWSVCQTESTCETKEISLRKLFSFLR